jgi:hypothetical protein
VVRVAVRPGEVEVENLSNESISLIINDNKVNVKAKTTEVLA